MTWTNDNLISVCYKITAHSPNVRLEYEEFEMIARDSLKVTGVTLNLEIFETEFEYQ